jgi:hypothetical protein
VARDLKAFLKPQRSGTTRSAVAYTEQHEDGAETPDNAQGNTREQRKRLREKRRELSEITSERRAAKRRADKAEQIEQVKRTKKKKQELFWLRNEHRAATGGSEAGALPDFVVIGGPKCGTTFFYHLLSKHPHVLPAIFKEPRYFDMLYEEGTEWYRRCFLPSAERAENHHR